MIRGFVAVLFASLAFASLASAQSTYAFVNMDRLLDEAKPAVEASKALEASFAPREEQLRALQENIKKLQASIEAAESEDEKNKGLAENVKLVREFKRSEAQFKRDLTRQKNEEYRRIRGEFEAVIREYAKSHEIGMVLSEGVLYANDGHNITEDILKILEEQSRDGN